MDTWNILEDLEICSTLREEDILLDGDETLIDTDCPIDALFDDHNVSFCHLCQGDCVGASRQHDEAMLLSVAASLGI